MKLPLGTLISDYPISILLKFPGVFVIEHLEEASPPTSPPFSSSPESMLIYFLVLGLGSLSHAQNAQPVGTLFQVDFSTNLNGGCQYVGQTAMQNILQDSLDLLGVGNQLVIDYSNNVGEARRLLDSFFQVGSPPMTADQLQAMQSEYSHSQGGMYLTNTHTNGTRSKDEYGGKLDCQWWSR